MPSLAEAYARLRALTAELAQVQATIDRLTLDPDVFLCYSGESAFGEREDHIVSHAETPYNGPCADPVCPMVEELTATFNRRQWRVDDNLNGETYAGDADNFADARRQTILAMADYMMKKEKT